MSTNGSAPRLKSLDLQGYKTFASRVVFEFAPTITAIVGPNGSGKSNIADSIRWVLGEQSYSLLRGKKTEDMIFAGSEGRSRSGMAAATITFDNQDGWLPIDFSEVTVSRRAYRSGENEYLLNGQRVRLRDVAELLARCGLGERTYTIIGQGLVDAALSLKAEERRRLFEEAAGIGLYRSRREESLRRLDHTRRNLDRVRDILTELRPRLRSLERQAKRAQDYEQVREDLNAALRQWYGHQWYRMVAVVAEAKRAADQVAADRERLHAEERQTAESLNLLRSTLETRRAQVQRLTAELTDVFRERETIGRNLAVLQERLRWVSDQATALEADLQARLDPERAADERLAAAREEVASRTRAVVEAESRRSTLLGGALSLRAVGEVDPEQARLRLGALRQEAAGAEARISQVHETLEAVGLELRAAEAQVERERQGREAARQRKAAALAALQEAERRRQSEEGKRERVSSGYEAARSALQQAQERASAERARMAAAEARLQQAADSEGEDAAALLGTAAERGELKGMVGRLSLAVRPLPEHQVAIRAALGAFADGIGLDSRTAADRAAKKIGQDDDSPAAALLVLDGHAPGARPPDVMDPDVLGNAADLARPNGAFRAAVDTLLRSTLVVRDRAAARRLAPSMPSQGRMVTLRGDVFLPDGHVLLNASRAHHSPAAVRERLKKAVDAAQGRLAEAEEEVARRAAEAESGRAEMLAAAEGLRSALLEETRLRQDSAAATTEEQLRSEAAGLAERRREDVEARRTGLERRLEQEAGGRGRLAEELERLDQVVRLDDMRRGGEAAAAHLAHAEASLDAARDAAAEAEERLADLEAASVERRQERDQNEARLRALREEQTRLEASVAAGTRTDGEIEARLNRLQESVAPSEAELTQAETDRSARERRESELRAEVQAVERRHSQAQIEWARRQEELSSLRRRVEDDFGLVAFDAAESPEAQVPIPFEGLVEHLAPVEELPPEYEGHVNRLRLQLRRMGAINPEARREYQEVRERFEFLTAQVEDLEQAESQLQGVIAELDVQMETEFQRTFEAVSREFRETFTRLFGGGSVRLTLTDPDDLSQTGIDIEARLPGRREQGLAMLSGGERSLTACALVFALLRVSPTPFCVLDEVDAMLDESNVARFRELLQELSGQTQFVIITHNRQTVQAAQALYGVSMGPDSASRVISLQLDEAERQMAE